jgi:hypothetical protein
MADIETFTLSESEARRMRRGAFLPILLILPIAFMFGLDSSKSQPLHFILTFSIAAVIAAIIVSVSWHGARRRIAEFSRISLSVEDGKIVWLTGSRRTELDLNEVTKVDAQGSRALVRSIVLWRADGKRTTLEGYERMNDLFEILRQQLDVEISRTFRWLGI